MSVNTDTSFLSEQDLQFYEFVKLQHGDQKRKYTFEPYHYHPLSVARIVAPYSKEHSPLTPIGLGHDLLEDTDCSPSVLFNVIKAIYGEYVEFIYSGIQALTNAYPKKQFPNLNRAERKKREASRMAAILPDYQTVKYADLIDNVGSIVDHDPKFAITYLEEKDSLLKVMDKGEFSLRVIARYEWQNAMVKLSQVEV